MSQRPRIQGPGLYHVTTRGNRGELIFENPIDPELLMHLLARNVRQLGWRCHAFCLMPNHYHLLVETLEPNLSLGMQRLNGVYAKWFNHAHAYEGHVFERRFRSIAVERDEHALELVRYLALNPVRAGLCRHPSEWRWSSYRVVNGDAPRAGFLTCDWILSLFDRDPRRARELLVAFVEAELVTARPAA